MKQRLLAIGLVGALVLGSTAPAWADNAGAVLPENSQWKPTEGRSPEGSFSRADQIILNQVATKGRLEELCRNLALTANLDLSLPSSDGDVTMGIQRRLVTLPSVENPQSLELYQVDEFAPGFGLTPIIELAERAEEGLGLGVGVSFSLDSTVVRPRAFLKNCEEVKDLLNIKDVRYVIPPSLLKHGVKPTAEEFIQAMTPRINAMEDGELWSLSGLTTVSASPEVGFTTGQVSAGVSIGGAQSGSAVMIVHKLSKTHTRFSLRVSHLHVFTAQGTVADVPIIDIFNPAGALTLRNSLEKIFNSAVVGQLAGYLTASFSVLQQIGNQSSQQYLIVFDLDTSDPAQVTQLAEMMQSDFFGLLKRAASLATLHASQKATLETFDRLTQKHEDVVERVASIVQTDVGLTDGNHSATLKLPVLGTHSRTSISSRNDVVTVRPNEVGEPASRELHLATAERPQTDVGFSIPLINKTVVNDTSDTKYTGFYFADNGKLQVVYTHLDAFQRRGAAAVQDTLNEFRDMLAVAGSRGDPAADAEPNQFQIALPPHDGRTLKSGSLAFTLNINAEGVEQAFHASGEEIEQAVRRIFPHPSASEDNADRKNSWNDVLAEKITKVLVQGRDQTPAQRSAALRDVMVAESNSNVVFDSLGTFFSFLPLPKPSDLAYEGTMKVLLELADPKNVSANLAMTIDTGRKHQPKAVTNVSVRENSGNADLLDAGLANRERTLQPKYMDVNP
jgi:hypothetical protein